MSIRQIKGAAAWASYIINDDPSGIDDDEIAACDAWLDRELAKNETIIDCADEPHFSWSFGAITGLSAKGGDLLEYTVFAR